MPHTRTHNQPLEQSLDERECYLHIARKITRKHNIIAMAKIKSHFQPKDDYTIPLCIVILAGIDGEGEIKSYISKWPLQRILAYMLDSAEDQK